MMKMSLGERAILKIPAAKAYGAAGAAGGRIPPNADLYFDVELLAVNGKERGTPEAPEQGFQGEDVAHKDGETCIEDWGREYGPDMDKPGGTCSGGDDEPTKKPLDPTKAASHDGTGTTTKPCTEPPTEAPRSPPTTTTPLGYGHEGEKKLPTEPPPTTATTTKEVKSSNSRRATTGAG